MFLRSVKFCIHKICTACQPCYFFLIQGASKCAGISFMIYVHFSQLLLGLQRIFKLYPLQPAQTIHNITVLIYISLQTSSAQKLSEPIHNTSNPIPPYTHSRSHLSARPRHLSLSTASLPRLITASFSAASYDQKKKKKKKKMLHFSAASPSLNYTRVCAPALLEGRRNPAGGCGFAQGGKYRVSARLRREKEGSPAAMGWAITFLSTGERTLGGKERERERGREES